MLNAIQKAAYELIQADARFLYTLIVIQRNATTYAPLKKVYNYYYNNGELLKDP